MEDDEKNPDVGPLPSAQVTASDAPIFIDQNILKGGEECWSCGVTPGSDPASSLTLKSIVITGAGEDFSEETGDWKQIEICEECAAEIFKYFTMEHLAFLKDREKNKSWIFAGNPYFPQE